MVIPFDASMLLWPGIALGSILVIVATLIVWFRSEWVLALFRPRPRNVLAWITSVTVAAGYVGNAWWIKGHVSCDFANQWLMGRMLYYFEGRNLYLVGPQSEALASGYSGVELLQMENDILFKGYEPGNPIEGPLYPPTHALLMYPFSILEPRAAHGVLVLVYAQLAFFAGWMVSILTQRRLGTGEATLGVLLFPNIPAAFLLAQNSVLTLAILATGWALWSRQRPVCGGMVWGLLAFKPVFAVTLLLAPIVYRQWRIVLGMAAGGGLFIAATLPFCGVGSWQRWLMVGRNAADIYANDRNWVWMSRDLIGLPRRAMWDGTTFWEHVKLALHLRGPEYPALQEVQNLPVRGWVGMGLVATVFAVTLALAMALARRQKREGPVQRRLNDPLAAFTLLGSLLTVYHFMHYDLLPMSVAILILVSNADQMNWRQRVVLILLWLALLYCLFDLTLGVGSVRIPLETFLMLTAWGWAGWLAWKQIPLMEQRHDAI